MKRLAGALLALIAAHAAAHDTWFSLARDGAGLELATGNRYPVADVSPGIASVQRAECADPAQRRFTPQPVEKNARWLDVRLTRPAVSCWAELKPFDIQLTPQLVQVYLDEIRAPAAVREAWANLQARSLPWRESYRKFARIELQPQLGVERKAAGLPMEIVLLGDAPLATAVPMAFQVLRDGQPLAGFAVELVSERSRLGVWRETDAEGKLRYTLPFAGQWLLRGTDVRVEGERFVSRFVTLAIDVR